MSADDATTLRQVVIVHRHGARFPTKRPVPGDVSWPRRAQFWESYKGHLTPVGCKQLQDIGSALAARYLQREGGLLQGVPTDGRVVAVYTSNTQRTLQSAWSLLLGLIPSAPVFFAFRSERVFSDAVRQAVGVPIYIEDAAEAADKLFHEWELDDGYWDWRKENIRRSRLLQRASINPEYIALLDKLHRCTGDSELRPGRGREVDLLSRLIAVKDVDTQVMIEEAHNRPVLPNRHGISISHSERRMLREVGDEIKRRWFGDAVGDRHASYGKQGAGYLAHKLWRHMQQRALGCSQLRFVQFSCHDTTMAALAAHFGVELPQMHFGAFFVLELHETTQGHMVKTFYNSLPAQGAASYASMRSLVLPLGKEEKLVRLAACPTGPIPLCDFEAHCRIPGLEESFEAFLDLLGRVDAEPTRARLQELLTEVERGWLSFDQWQQRHGEAFRRLDSNGDGGLDFREVQAALAEWGYGASDDSATEKIFRLVDREPYGESMTEEDVYLAMCALVGVRGSISSKKQQDDQGLANALSVIDYSAENCLI